MIKAFGLTFVFWTLFVLFNSASDAILFYSVFPWYKNMDIWHTLKYFWIGFAVLTGWFACLLCDKAWHRMPFRFDDLKKYRLKMAGIFGFFLAWFLFLRWILHETFMEIWRTP
jgi:hypothetical protein